MIGTSLIDDFSEIDSTEGNGYDSNKETRNNNMASVLQNRNL